MMEKVLRLLFATKVHTWVRLRPCRSGDHWAWCACGQDLSKIKAYLVRQWTKQRAGQLTAKDFIFAKEVRIGTYSSNGALPPAAVVASKMMMADRRAEPRYGERVPYVVRDDVGLSMAVACLTMNEWCRGLCHRWCLQLRDPL